MKRVIVTPNGYVETAGCPWCTDEAVCAACHEKARALRVVKACKCGHRFTRDAWQALPYVGKVPGEPPLEMRNCICGSTLAIEEPQP